MLLRDDQRTAGAVALPADGRPHRYRTVVAWAPVVVLAAVVVGKVVAPGVSHRLVREDNLVEYLTALAYVLAGAAALVAARRLHRGLAPRWLIATQVALGVLLLAVAGEEVSWGQRLLGFDGPGFLVDANAQGEPNVHNLLGHTGLHAVYIVGGTYLLVGRRLWRAAGVHPDVARFLAPGRRLAAWFLPLVLLYLYYQYLSGPLVAVLGDSVDWGDDHFVVADDQETVELLAAVGLALFSCGSAGRARPREAEGPADGA